MCNLLQFSQTALQADISDGDYRTYMILYSLAADDYQETGNFTVELTYTEIGQSHPKLLSAAGVRSRINRLVKAGLVTRQRIDSKRWWTIPVGGNLAGIPSSVVTQNTQTVAAHNTQSIGALPTITPSAAGDVTNKTQVVPPLPDATPESTSDATQNTQSAATQSTQTTSALPTSTPTVMTATDDNAQTLVSVAADRTQPTVTEITHGTQLSLTVTSEDTQNDVHVVYQEEQISVFDGEMNPLGRKQNGFISTEPVPRPENGPSSGKEFMNRSLARRVLVRTAIEQADAFLNGEVVEHVSAEMGVASGNAPSLIIDHDDLYNSSIHEHDQNQSDSNSTDVENYDGLTKESTLATVLANLPQPMSPDGIVECVADPELCAAWLDYATNPNAGVRNPAAYVRKGIRSGKYPPTISKTYISPNSPIYRPSYTEIVQSKPSAM